MSSDTLERPRHAAGAPGGSASGRPARRRSFTVRKGLGILAFLAPALIFVAVFIYYPMISGSQMAFRNWNLNNLSDTSWVGFKNFATIFADPVFYTVLRNSVVWVIGSIIPQFVIGFAIALWLRRKFRFRGVYQALIFFPWSNSRVLIAILFRWMFNNEFPVVNNLLQKSALIDPPVPWLANPSTAMGAVLIAHT